MPDAQVLSSCRTVPRKVNDEPSDIEHVQPCLLAVCLLHWASQHRPHIPSIARLRELTSRCYDVTACQKSSYAELHMRPWILSADTASKKIDLFAELLPERLIGGRDDPVERPISSHLVQHGDGCQLACIFLILLSWLVAIQEGHNIPVTVSGIRQHHLPWRNSMWRLLTNVGQLSG